MNIKGRERIDWLLKQVFRTAGLLTIALLAGIFIMLLYNGIAFFTDVRPLDFFTGSQWDPEGAKSKYGIAPLLVSTGLVTVGSMVISVPIGILTAAFLSELAPPKVTRILKPVIEMLAALRRPAGCERCAGLDEFFDLLIGATKSSTPSVHRGVWSWPTSSLNRDLPRHGTDGWHIGERRAPLFVT